MGSGSLRVHQVAQVGASEHQPIDNRAILHLALAGPLSLGRKVCVVILPFIRRLLDYCATIYMSLNLIVPLLFRTPKKKATFVAPTGATTFPLSDSL